MKKTVRVRRRVTEQGPLEVVMTPADAPPAQPGQTPVGQTTVDVNAKDPMAAIQQAMQQVPGKKLDAVTVQPKGRPMANGPTPAPGVGPQPNLAVESFKLNQYRYPYEIVVPKVFESVLQKAITVNRKGVTGIVYGHANGRVHIQVENAGAMATLVSRLGKSRDARARTILEGIKNSR